MVCERHKGKKESMTTVVGKYYGRRALGRSMRRITLEK
jgi:hypothetical protein